MFCASARLNAGATEFESAAEMAMTFTFFETRLLMNGICASPVAVEGATKSDFPRISFCASAAPSPVALKYGSVSSFGIKPIAKSAPAANPVVTTTHVATMILDMRERILMVLFLYSFFSVLILFQLKNCVRKQKPALLLQAFRGSNFTSSTPLSERLVLT